MLRYTALGSKILLGIFGVLAAVGIYLPFLEAFALTPAIAFVHRFSITLNIGSNTKTLQPIVFVIPILLCKGIWEFSKKYSLRKLILSKLSLIIFILVGTDLISLATSTVKGSSIGIFITHGMNWAIFITATIWLRLVSDMIDKENLRRIGTKLLKTFAIALIAFTVINSIVSATQFFDCSLSSGCKVWSKVDEAFPNKLLLVGHQKFSYKPNVIRAPGFFGDVNFNGMFSLFITLISGTLIAFLELTKTTKGYLPNKEQRWLLVPLTASIISFILTLSRSAMLGAGVTGLFVLLVFVIPLLKTVGVSKKLATRVGKFSLVTTIMFVVLFMLGYLVPLQYNQRKTTLSREIILYVRDMFKPEEDSAKGHAELFASAVKIGNQNPLFGMGMGTFGIHYEKIIKPGGGTNANPHSTYGMLYAEQGWIGVIIYLGIIMYLWFTSFKTLRKLLGEIRFTKTNEKKTSKDFFYTYGAKLFLTLLGLGVPYFSIATVSYYGFFLPMVWWWGNGELLKIKSS
ncbi:O-antigen ligase family protein [bacterium]|nr:O-antigen ligase family protein [bacterium]